MFQHASLCFKKLKTWLGLVRVGEAVVVFVGFVVWVVFFFSSNWSPFCSFPVFGIRLLSSTITLPNPAILFYPVMVSLKMQRNHNDVKWEPQHERSSL